MGSPNPLYYVSNGVLVPVDALQINGLVSVLNPTGFTNREIIGIGDDTDYVGNAPVVAKVDPTTRALKVYVAGGSVGAALSASSNVAVAQGAAAVAAVAGSGHLYSVTVIGVPGGSAAIAITDGPSGPEIAYVPANFPGGDIPIFVPKIFLTSLYVHTGNTSPPSPAISMGVSA